ncbi:MAG: hypothetical protein IKP23_01790 [Elusimicrobiaceae bacterium]|nr:hypothetical protein [Elusimicrobiaceae bacterium]
MTSAFENMRNFWLDIDNFKNKDNQEMPAICVCGIEFCMLDHYQKPKKVFIAASYLGNASMYFENNSKSGIGGFIGNNSKEIKEASFNFLKEAQECQKNMAKTETLPLPTETGKITLFTIGKEGVFTFTENEDSLRNQNNLFYKFYMASQHLIGVFRLQQDAQQKPAQA